MVKTIRTSAEPGTQVRAVLRTGEFDPDARIVSSSTTDDQGNVTFSVPDQRDYFAAWQTVNGWESIGFTTRSTITPGSVHFVEEEPSDDDVAAGQLFLWIEDGTLQLKAKHASGTITDAEIPLAI